MSVQAQWNLDHSAADAVHLAKGVLQAATTDNVQVLAILACERFGATLAMSRETNEKIEREVAPGADSSLLAFLKVHIGYLRNDCAEQLGRSLAGIQFLGLAAALVTTMSLLKSAEAIQEMLVDTAEDKALIPTVRQVQQLLLSIEPKCHQAGFASEVVGWQILLNGTLHHYFKIWDPSIGLMQGNREGMPRAPDSQGVRNLVTALRELRRIGSDNVTEVVIRTPPLSAAWTIAFVKWSLGIIPAVSFQDGMVFQAQHNAEVHILIADQGAKHFQVTIHSSAKDPFELVESELGLAVQGMVKPFELGTLLLQSQELDKASNELGHRAIHQAIPYALNQVLQHLCFIYHMEEDMSFQKFVKKPPTDLTSTNEHFKAHQLSPFRETIVLSQAYCLLFGIEDVKALPKLDNGLLLQDLPVVKRYLDDLREKCGCQDCHPDYPEVDESCFLQDFWMKLCVQIAVVLGLALFYNPDNLKLCIDSVHAGNNFYQNDFLPAILSIITTGRNENCAIRAFNNWVLKLVGHPNPIENERRNFPTLSAYKGQAIWLTIHQSYRCASRDFSLFLGSLVQSYIKRSASIS